MNKSNFGAVVLILQCALPHQSMSLLYSLFWPLLWYYTTPHHKCIGCCLSTKGSLFCFIDVVDPTYHIIWRTYHDDVIKRKHFPRYWPFVRGIHRSPVNSPHKGQWRGALMFSLICVCIKGWVNNREAGDLRRYRAHYDVIVMNGGKLQ